VHAHRILSARSAPADPSVRQIDTYRSGGLRRTRSVRRYTDRLIRARVAAAMAPAHQYQPPSVTAATIKPAASETSVKASPSRHHRGNPELTLWSVIGPEHHGGSSGRHARPCGSVGTPGRDLRIRRSSSSSQNDSFHARTADPIASRYQRCRRLSCLVLACSPRGPARRLRL
jgi:hypothetical protein